MSLLVKKMETAKINESLIIKEILKNSQGILDGKVMQKDIADKVSISHSSVSRLMSKYGFKNWHEFRNSCVIEEMFYTKTTGGMIDKMYLQSTFLKQWMKSNDNHLEYVTNKIKDSKLVIFFGERISGNIAQYMSFMMSYKNIVSTHFFFEQELIPLLGNSTTLVIMSSSNRTNYDELISIANKKGASVVLIDASPNDLNNNISYNINLPIISYIKEKDILSYLKAESIKEFLINIYEKL